LTQATTLTKSVEGDPTEFYFTCAAIGLRRAEIAGLLLNDFSLNDGWTLGALNIAHTLQRVPKKGLVLLDVKSKKSRRQIKLPKFFIDSYQRHLMMRGQQRIDAEKEWKEMGFVFTNRHGGPVAPERIHKIHKAALKKAKLPDIRFHDLRHTAATLLIAKGVPLRMVSEILGHSTPQFTMSVYGHVTEGMRDQTTDAFDQMYGSDADTIGVPASDKLQ
jgi:integrase